MENHEMFFKGDIRITITPSTSEGELSTKRTPWKLAAKIHELVQDRKASIVLVQIRDHGMVSYTKLADHRSNKYLDSLSDAELPQSVSVWDDQGYYIFLAYDMNKEGRYEHGLVEWDPTLNCDIPPIPTNPL